MLTHFEYMKRTAPARECSVFDVVPGGRCVNCGFDPDLGDIDPTISTWEMDQKRIDQAVAQIPERFGLFGFPGQVFSIKREACYVNDTGKVILYTQVLCEDRWLSFAKGTLSELLNEIKEVKS